jgi:hypothetical protein
MAETNTTIGPKLDVKPTGVARGPQRGLLNVAWRISNLASLPVQIVETWIPHGRFFAARQALEPSIYLLEGESATVHRSVRFVAEPGEIVENAFLNLRVRYGGGLWRILTRLRVEPTAANSVSIVVEAVTTHPVGFAEQPAHGRTPMQE